MRPSSYFIDIFIYFQTMPFPGVRPKHLHAQPEEEAGPLAGDRTTSLTRQAPLPTGKDCADYSW